MDAFFALEQAVGVVALDAQGHALDARLVAGQVVQNFHLEPLFVRPAQVHAFQHFGPVLGLGAARAGVDVQKGVHVVRLVRQQDGHFRGCQQFIQAVGLFIERRQGLFLAFLGQVQPFPHVVMAGFQLAKTGHFPFQTAFFPQNRRQGLLIGPGVRPRDDFFDFFQARLPRGEVKDASRASRIVPKARRSANAVLPVAT